MLTNLFSASTIPILEEVAKFSQARHTTLAGNIANLDTPGYKFRDLSVDDFQSRLRTAIDSRHRPPDPYQPGRYAGSEDAFQAAVAKNPHTILYHDKSNVELEQQVSEMVKNHMQHNLALTVMNQQFRLLTTAISLRV
jgi:flagellar basal-body rod protein FlgB